MPLGDARLGPLGAAREQRPRITRPRLDPDLVHGRLHLAVGVMAAWGAGGYVVARARFGWEPRER